MRETAAKMNGAMSLPNSNDIRETVVSCGVRLVAVRINGSEEKDRAT